MRRVALALHSFDLPHRRRRRAARSRRSTAVPQATPKIDTIPPARDVPYPGTIQLTVDATDVTRAIFRVHEHVPVSARRRFRPALSQVASGQPLAFGADQQGRRLPRDRERTRAELGPRHARRLCLPRRRPAGRQRDRRRLPICFADRRQPGPDRRDAGHGEHRVDRQFAVPGRLFRPRHPDPGVGDRSDRLEGRDRASPERRRPATGSTIRSRATRS